MPGDPAPPMPTLVSENSEARIIPTWRLAATLGQLASQLSSDGALGSFGLQPVAARNWDVRSQMAVGVRREIRRPFAFEQDLLHVRGDVKRALKYHPVCTFEFSPLPTP